ncbi:MAG TPA: DNA primase, partial [Rhodospirillales bacterium]
VPRSSPADHDREVRAKTLLDVVELACKFFERQLRLPEGKAALEYLKGRGIHDEMMQRFRLGVAPDGRGALKAYLGREGIGEELMMEAGLVIRPDDPTRGTYDRFRGRVMFPIMDARGRVIAFGGRVMGQGEPKYLNSPETPLFHKGFNLYGLSQALPAIRDKSQAVVVEGYTDVIALHQAGIASAVAPLGTALTEDQMKLLWRHAAEPILCFDGDAAGQRAAARAAERGLPILVPGKGLRFVELPAGEDPDTLVRARGAAAMAELLQAARPLSEVIWQIETRGRRIATPEERAGLDARFRELTQRISDETVRRHYQSAYRGRVWDLYRQARSGGKVLGAGRMQERAGDARIDSARLQEEILLATLLSHPGLMDAVGEEFGAMALKSPDLDRLRQEVLKTLSVSPDLDAKGLGGQLCRTGFSDLLSGLLSRRVFSHARFARPDEPVDYAERGWKQLYRLYRRAQLLEEIEAVTALCGIEGSPGNFALLKALKEEAASLVMGPAVGTDVHVNDANDAA